MSSLKFTGISAVLASTVISLTGCHSCPPPEQSLECYPICKKLKTENAEKVQAKWKNFRETPFYPFIPTGRYRKIDELGKIISQLSYQIKYEIVIPYIELDREGLITAFYEFEQDVVAVMEVQKCDQNRAMRLVLEDWQRMPDGREKCRKLVHSLPVLHSLRINNQILTALQRINPADAMNLAILILADPNFKKEFNMLQADIRHAYKGNPAARKRLFQVRDTASSAAIIAGRLINSAGFLKIYLDDKSSQRESIEKFIADIGRLSETQHD